MAGGTNLKSHHLLLFYVPILAVSINNITNLSSKARLKHNGGQCEVFQFTGVPGGETSDIDSGIYREVAQHEVLFFVLQVLRLPHHIQSEGEPVLEQAELHPVPGARVEGPAQCQGLRPAPEVEPAPQTTGHQLQLEEVVVTSVVQIQQEAVGLPSPELQL